MRKGVADISEEQIHFSSNLAPGPAQRRLALVLVLALLIVFFLVIRRYGSIQLAPVAGFVVGLKAGRHQVLFELADPTHRVITRETVKFTVPEKRLTA